MVQVFINQIPVISYEVGIEDLVNPNQVTSGNILDLIESLENGEIRKPVRVSLSAEELIEEVLKEATLVEAAGGIVFEPGGRFLIIYRRGWWDLPKGKLDQGETPEQAAIREVIEECGLQNLSLVRAIPDSYHTYREKGRLILKKTYWFEMKIPSKQNPELQIEEDIEDSAWVNLESMGLYKAITYPNILEVIKSRNRI